MGSKGLYTEERLATPIKHFISYLVQELLIGIPSEVKKYFFLLIDHVKAQYCW